MRRWFGVALLGFVGFVFSMMAYMVTLEFELDSSALPVLIGRLLLTFVVLASAVAVVVGVIGVGMAAIRGDRRPGHSR